MRRGLHLVLVATLAGAIALGASGAAPAGAENNVPDPGWIVSPTSATTNLTDGQFVALNVKARSTVVVNALEVRECRFGPDYAAEPLGLSPNGGNCPPIPISSSAFDVINSSAGDGLPTLARSSFGKVINFQVGTGVVNWTVAGNQNSLTCDASHACALVAKLSLAYLDASGVVTHRTTEFSVTPLGFTDADPIASCGGPAADVLSSAGSDELSDAWAGWTRKFCAGSTAGAPSRAAFTSEGDAVTSFSTGAVDVAYTASGYNSSVGLAATEPNQRRAAVAVPIALNAAVIAAGGGAKQIVGGEPIGDKVPYPDGSLSMSLSESSALVGGGLPWVFRIGGNYYASFLGRNPVLSNIPTAPGVAFMASSEELSSTWFTTNYLATLRPDEFIKPNVTPPVRRPAAKSLAKADPSYDDVFLFTGRPVLGRNTLAAFLAGNDGPMWVMTDRVTAKALNLTPVALEDAAGDFVAPSADTMSAAVPTLKKDAAGLRLPDPNAAGTEASAAAGDAYPLTYVEYAMVPAEPLVGDGCTPRTGSQQLLEKWLTYVTGTGQQSLPAGLEPLTPELQSEAKAAIAKVGASPVTGTCATALQGLDSATGMLLPTASLPLGNVPTGLPPTAVAATAAKAAKKKAELLAVPAFAGSTVPSSSAGAIALLGIVFVTSLGIYLTSRSTPTMAGAGTGGGVLALGAGAAGVGAARAARPMSPRRRALTLTALWVGVAVASFGLVIYSLEPLFQQRDQQQLLADYRGTVRKAAYATSGLPQAGEANAGTKPPEVGAPVGVLEVGSLESQQVVIEGISAEQTQKGPGHVPGTAGLGQPGNAVVVARRNSFGGSFAKLADLEHGDKIVATTTQGQSVYVVQSVSEREIVDKVSDKQTQIKRDGAIKDKSLFGPSAGDQLTLVTSASSAPWNTTNATVVVAKLRGDPFEPTQQGARTEEQTKLGGDGSAWPAIFLVILGYALVIGASILIYRRMQFRTAYLLTIAPIVALTVIAAETLSRLIPSWT